MGVGGADTARAKTVGEKRWLWLQVQALKQLTVPVFRVNERETFRFGPGERIWSEFAVLLPVGLGQAVVWVRILALIPLPEPTRPS